MMKISITIKNLNAYALLFSVYCTRNFYYSSFQSSENKGLFLDRPILRQTPTQLEKKISDSFDFVIIIRVTESGNYSTPVNKLKSPGYQSNSDAVKYLH